MSTKAESEEASPGLSVVVVAYERPDEVTACLKALSEQTVAHEVILVDNSASDKVAAMVRADFADVRYLREGINDGYAGGNNRGLALARGERVLVLNPDTMPFPQALERMLETLARHPGSIVTAKLIGSDGKLNAVGNRMHFSGVVTCNGLGDEVSQWAGDVPVLLASGAAVLADRETWDALDGFDSDFFLYMEDADLSLRARLLDREIWCAADAEIGHRYALSMRPEKFYWLCRNRWFTLLKTFEAKTLRSRLTGLMLTEGLVLGYAFSKGPSYLWAWIRAWRGVWRARGSIRRKRLAIQRTRLVSDGVFAREFSRRLPYAQLVNRQWVLSLIDALTNTLSRRTMGEGRGRA